MKRLQDRMAESVHHKCEINAMAKSNQRGVGHSTASIKDTNS